MIGRMVGRAYGALVALLVLAVPAHATPRVHGGAGLALDPAFGSVTAGADWFFTEALALGLAYAQTLPGVGDQRAIETGSMFVNALARLRLHPGPRLRAELFGGAGLARIRYGEPGAHTEFAPDVAIGAALGRALGRRWELALEVTTHVTLGKRTGTRNPAHTSELIGLVARWGL